MKFKNLTILSILTIALLSGCSDKEKIDENTLAKSAETQKETQKVQKAPVFNLKTSEGKTIKVTADVKNGWKFEGYEDKVVLLDFFGTWCPPCKAEIPHLNNIREKVKDNFEIIGVEVGTRSGMPTPANELNQFIKDYKIKYPVTTAGDNNMLFGAVSELNPNGSIPFMVMFNKKGEFVQYYIGMKPEEMLFRDINTAIKMK